MTPLNFYTDKIAAYDEKIKRLKKKITLFSFLRLISFILFVLFLYVLNNNYSGPSLLTAILSLACFIIFINISFSLNAAKKLAEKMLFINKNEHTVINHGENAFKNGSDIQMSFIYRDDLDIFGPRSLYHLLNRTTTSHGAETLSALLASSHHTKENIAIRQEAVKQFAPQRDICQTTTAQGLLHNEEQGNMNDLSQWIEMPHKLAGLQWLNIARFIMPVWNVSAFLFYLSEDNPIPLGAGVIISWIITGAFFKYINKQHELIGKKQSILEQYGTILQHFGKTDAGNSTLLGRLKDQTILAYKEILKLSRLAALFDQRLNLIVAIFANSLFLYDIQCIIALEKWKRRNKNHFREWMNCVGNIETINSLATFAFNNPGYCFPEVTEGEGKPFISATKMGHPLMQLTRPVVNDIIAGKDDKLLLVTGSNMSGKSTFLRTIGINLLLAQCGAPAYADSFRFTPMSILSSIRISDSLQENTSYFMAELKRLHDIITELEKGGQALVLIDEVLRGTNSDDKTHGSEAFIKKLLHYKCLALFATHDLSLSELENTFPGVVNNYCFESVIENGELLFDYTLRRGVAKNRNASFLMQKMGII